MLRSFLKFNKSFSTFISTAEAKALIQLKPNVKFLDVRAPDKFSQTHLPNSFNLHQCFTYLLECGDQKGLKSMQDFFTQILNEEKVNGGNDETIITYEDGMSSGYSMSCRAAFILKYLGHPNVHILDGGLSAWLLDGGEVTDQPNKFKQTANGFNPQVQQHMIATTQDVHDVVKDDNTKVKLLDSRDKEEYIGESSSPYGKDFTPRKGRIPKCKWIEWYDMMEQTEEGITYMKSGQDVKKIVKEKTQGWDTGDDIIIYCFKGSRSSNTYFQLQRAGFSNLRNYFGSWNEWSRDMNLPIDDTVIQV